MTEFFSYVASDFLVTNEQLANSEGEEDGDTGGKTKTGRRATEKGAGRRGGGRGRRTSLTPHSPPPHTLCEATGRLSSTISRFKKLLKWGMSLVDGLTM